jgi:hypothetical protein
MHAGPATPTAALALDAAIAAKAARQHGIVSRAQLRALGMTDSAISRAAAGGRLHTVQRVVFAFRRASARRTAHDGRV